MKLTFADQAWEDYLYWQATDAAISDRLKTLIKECRHHPFTGTGRPEPLKGDLNGWWSRRITLQDRLVYRAAGAGPDQTIEIAQVRFHY